MPYLQFCHRNEGIVLELLLELLWEISLFLEANASVAGLVGVLQKESLSPSLNACYHVPLTGMIAHNRHAAAHMKTPTTSAAP